MLHHVRPSPSAPAADATPAFKIFLEPLILTPNIGMPSSRASQEQNETTPKHREELEDGEYGKKNMKTIPID